MFSKSEAPLQERCTGCQIAAGCPFTQLSSLALDYFVSFSRLKTYSPGITIFRQDEEALGLFIIRSGWLKLSHITSEGHALTIGFCGPGNILGLTESLTDGLYEVNAVTLL